MRIARRATFAAALAVPTWWTVSLPAAPRADGQLELVVVDADTLQPLAARMHLNNARGRPVVPPLPPVSKYADHFYVDGRLRLPLRRGQYTFELEAGPEYRTQSGHFEIERHADDSKTIQLHRFADLAAEGWYAGDLDVARPEIELPLAMRAEALALVAKRSTANHPIARTPFDWDLPIWLASGKLDAIQLIHHHALRDGVVDNEAGGRPRDRVLFPGATGNGRWSEAIYYHVLECGLRIPPAAGSGSGENDNPLGTNRVYVHCGEAFSADAWWEGLVAGRVFVTNGPLLRPLVRGQPPGYVFHLETGGPLSLEIGLELATRVPVEYLQIVKNGNVDAEVRLDEFAEQGGRSPQATRRGELPPVEFEESGWFLVRAVTTNRHVYQFASSGPYYVEAAGSPRVSRRSVQFFLDWIDAAEARIRTLPDLDDSSRDSQLAALATARQFFAELLAAANAD